MPKFFAIVAFPAKRLRFDIAPAAATRTRLLLLRLPFLPGLVVLGGRYVPMGALVLLVPRLAAQVAVDYSARTAVLLDSFDGLVVLGILVEPNAVIRIPC